jgi:hypothetical protein
MRVWRVGTISMGASLLFLGIILLFSNVLGLNLYQVMLAWWPIILVVLGSEILLFLIISKQEKPFLKYDFMSIILVGILGMVGIGFMIVGSTGLIEKISDVFEREQRTLELPVYSENIDRSITRIVVKTANQPITIEGTSKKEISIFGTYRAELKRKEKLINQPEDYLSVQQTADTLFIEVKALPRQLGPFDTYTNVSATLLIPSDVKLELLSLDNTIRLKPRTLLSNWSVDGASEVLLYVEDDSDVTVDARGVILGSEEPWIITKQPVNQNEVEYQGHSGRQVTATYQSGKGTYHIQIINSYRVRLSTVK